MRKKWLLTLHRECAIVDKNYGPALAKCKILVALRPGQAQKDVVVTFEGLRAEFTTILEISSQDFMAKTRNAIQRAYDLDCVSGYLSYPETKKTVIENVR